MQGRIVIYRHKKQTQKKETSKTNQDYNIRESRFSNADNVRAPVKFKGEGHYHLMR